jgi:hypothetical protein
MQYTIKIVFYLETRILLNVTLLKADKSLNKNSI